ncbi:MAG: hypothetical protein IIT49_04830, partial [Clostridia bacterium]|nr:hypothetical protein [Clostridia bacterium]
MDNKRISKAFIALLASAVVVASGVAALPANAASSSTTASSVSATVASKLSASFSALSPYKISTTQSFAVAASINEGTAPYTYKFGYIKDGKTTYVKTVKTNAPYYKYDYKFKTEGSYIPVLVVTDSTGKKVTYKLKAVTVKDLKILFGKAGSNIIDKSQAFQATTSVGGGDPEYTYKYGYIKDGVTKNVKTIKTSAPYTTYTYKFTEAGTYTPFVEVIDKDGARTTVKQANVTVKDLQISFGKAGSNIIDKSQAFQATTSVSGGKTDYTYRYGYIKDGVTKFVKTIKTPAPYTTYTYKFTEAGTYTPFVEIVDADGARRTVKQTNVTVKDLQIAFGKAGSNKISTEQAFQATTSVSGGKTDYTYNYGYIKNGVSKFVKTVKTPAPYTTYTYKFTEAGTYTPFVEVVDADGARRTVKQADVTVKDFKVDFGSVSSYNIKKTQAFQTTASLSNGSGTYTYRFGYIQNGSKTYLDSQRTGSP